MNLKRLGLATLAVFVVLSLVDGVFHGLMMADTYQAMQSVWRPDMAGKMWLMNVLTLFFAFMFFRVPAGLCLYFITSSAWGLAERKLLPKSKPGGPTAGTPAPRPVKKPTSNNGAGGSGNKKRSKPKRR